MEATLRNPHGQVHAIGPYGELFTADTHQCPHCGNHWAKVPGSGKLHILCGRCHDPKNKRSGWLCEACSRRGECVPVEQMLDNIEHGREWFAPRPESVNVPKVLWLPGGE